ncbi:hypothetical protein FIBSPDRAFT_1053515 [Athelia psychrophila]|uniref:Uncharacterized protein n=1 Tax=Athelia psychrophila TaxID=1759441 RepID=A0A167WUF9_9AGAM|nr:hypothetical protein FIBSPDRAFT_1053515 [Fibularhizoctonia sp. CBS 109695]
MPRAGSPENMSLHDSAIPKPTEFVGSASATGTMPPSSPPAVTAEVADDKSSGAKVLVLGLLRMREDQSNITNLEKGTYVWLSQGSVPINTSASTGSHTRAGYNVGIWNSDHIDDQRSGGAHADGA